MHFYAENANDQKASGCGGTISMGPHLVKAGEIQKNPLLQL
jgi:hypothetical protein